MKNELFSSFEWNISQKVSQQEWNYRSFDSRQNRHWSGSYWGTGESHTEVIAKFKRLISMSSNMLHRFIKPFLSPTIKFSFIKRSKTWEPRGKTGGTDIQDKWEDLRDFWSLQVFRITQSSQKIATLYSIYMIFKIQFNYFI